MVDRRAAAAQSAVERLQGFMESSFEQDRHFANHLDVQLQLDAWFQKTSVGPTARAQVRLASPATLTHEWTLR